MDEKDVKELAKEIAKELSQNGIELTADYREVVMERNHALVELADAKARLAGYEWIPVSERLPEDGESVLIAVDSAFAPYCHVYEAFHHSAATQWATANGLYFHGVEYARVTHWMPLPEAPKEEE